MLPRALASGIIVGFFLLCSAAAGMGQTSAFHAPVLLTVVDENGLPVSDAHVTVSDPGGKALQLETDYAGRCTYPFRKALYQIRVDKPGFYQAVEPNTDARVERVEVVLAHQQIIRQ